MAKSTIAIIILIIMMIMVMNDRIPLAVTAVFAALAMVLTGVQDLKYAYSYFGDQTVVFIAATMMISTALFETGAIQKVTKILFSKIAEKSERALVTAFSLFTGLITGFTTNSAIAATLTPIAQSIAKNSNGKIKVKNLLMPVGTMSTIGSPLSMSGAGAVAAACALVIEAGGELRYFTMAPVALVCIFLGTAYFATFGYNIMIKAFDFDDPEIEISVDESLDSIPKWKPVFAIIVFILVVIGFVIGVWNVAICSMLGVLLLWITGTVKVKDSIKGCDWNVVIVLAAVSSMANGLNQSGAGEVIANKAVDLLGGPTASPTVIMLALGIVAWGLSQFMNNTAANLICVPIAISMANALNVNILYFCVPIIVGTAIAVATPLASPTTVIVMQGGFRFKDFVKVGIPLSLVCLIGMFLTVPIFFHP